MFAAKVHSIVEVNNNNNNYFLKHLLRTTGNTRIPGISRIPAATSRGSVALYFTLMTCKWSPRPCSQRRGALISGELVWPH